MNRGFAGSTLTRLAILAIVGALAATLVGAAPVTAAKRSFAQTVTNTLQKAHVAAGAGAMKTDSCLAKIARRTVSKAVKSHRIPSRGAVQRKADRSCKVSGVSARITKTKSATRAGKSLRSGLRRQLAKPATNRVGVATKRAHGRRVTVALVATHTSGSSSAPAPTPSPVVPADFVARARAEFVRLVNLERMKVGANSERGNACLDGVAQGWAEHIAAIHTIDHNTGPGGTAGYQGCSPIPPGELKYSGFSEIIAQVTQRQAATPEGLAAAAVESFLNSPPHKARMLLNEMYEHGVGIAFDSGVGYWKLVSMTANYSPR